MFVVDPLGKLGGFGLWELYGSFNQTGIWGVCNFYGSAHLLVTLGTLEKFFV